MTELQNDRMTDRTKTICPPIFDLGGIKSKTLLLLKNLLHKHLTNFNQILIPSSRAKSEKILILILS